MALIGWWPLNGDLEDYSGNNRPMRNCGHYIDYSEWSLRRASGRMLMLLEDVDDGKIGRTFLFPNNPKLYMNVEIADMPVTFTWTIWIYAQSTGGRQFIMSYGRDCLDLGINIGCDTSGNLQAWVGANGDSVKTINYNLFDKWTHVAFSYGAGVLSIYINGQLNSTHNIASINFTQVAKKMLVLGKMSYEYTSSTTYFPFAGKLNDIRIYNEVLSLAEIQEIAKAKILHYNFNDPYVEPTTNLISFINPHGCSKTILSETYLGDPVARFTVTNPGVENNFGFSQDKTVAISPSTTHITISFMCRVLVSPGWLAGYIWVNYSDGSVVKHSWPYRPSDIFSSQYLGEWKKVTATVQLSAGKTPTNFTNIYVYRDNAAANVSFDIAQVQIEEKDHSTPYTIDARIGGRVRDLSGYGRHSSPLSAEYPVSIVNSNGRYASICEFGRIVTNDTFLTTQPIFTYSCWIKTADSEAYLVMGGQLGSNTSMSLAIIGGKIALHTYGHTPDTNSDRNWAYGSTRIDTGTWTHCAITYDGVRVISYVNGIQDGISDNVLLDFNKNAQPFVINYDPLSDFGNFNCRRYIGDLADVRVYATSLSSLDIKQLYDTKGRIFKNGKIEVGEIETQRDIEIPVSEIGIGGLTTTIVSNALSPNGKSRTFQIGPSRGSFRFNFPLSVLTPLAGKEIYVKYRYQILSGGGFAPTGWCDGAIQLTASATSHMVKCSRSQYDSTYRFLDHSADANSVINISDFKIMLSPQNSRVTNSGALITEDIIEQNYKPSLITYSHWTPGTMPSGFSNNGSAAENKITIKANPYGDLDVVWATESNDATSDGDGGFNGSSSIAIDKTKTYRMSVWVKREDVGNGRFYFGCNGHIANISDGADNGNPYFTYFTNSDNNCLDGTWCLAVAYVHPHTYTGSTLSTSGIYPVTTKQKVRSCTDYKMRATATGIGIRSYLYYSTSVDEKMYWYRPRIDLVDGTEPSIENLLACAEHTPLLDIPQSLIGMEQASFSKNGTVIATEFIEN